MIELKAAELYYVSGGNVNGDPNCPGCNGEWDQKETEYKTPVSFGEPGTGSTIGGVIGSTFFGKYGTAIGTAVGYLFYDSVDYHQVGENYKMQIMSELNSGNLPAD